MKQMITSTAVRTTWNCIKIFRIAAHFRSISLYIIEIHQKIMLVDEFGIM